LTTRGRAKEDEVAGRDGGGLLDLGVAAESGGGGGGEERPRLRLLCGVEECCVIKEDVTARGAGCAAVLGMGSRTTVWGRGGCGEFQPRGSLRGWSGLVSECANVGASGGGPTRGASAHGSVARNEDQRRGRGGRTRGRAAARWS
jgi:hypothetical protein